MQHFFFERTGLVRGKRLPDCLHGMENARKENSACTLDAVAGTQRSLVSVLSTVQQDGSVLRPYGQCYMVNLHRRCIHRR